MYGQIKRTIFNPKLHILIDEIRGTVKDYMVRDEQERRKPENLANLREELELIVETSFDDIEDLRGAIEQELRFNDYALKDLTGSLADHLIRDTYNREYNLITKCPSCSTNGTRSKERAKSRQVVRVDDYVFEADVVDGSFIPDLVAKGFVDTCKRGKCQDTPLEIVNAANVVLPDDDHVIHLISSRVKTTGRYCHKLVDRILYEMSDELGWKDPEDVQNSRLAEGEEEIIVGSKRSIVDRFAFSIIVDYPNGWTESEFRKRYKRVYGATLPTGRGITAMKRMFSQKYGINMPRVMTFEDLVCYNLLEQVSQKFQVYMGRLDDRIQRPKVRMTKGVREEFKMLQFPLHFKGMAFEGQIKLRSVYEREQNRKSAFSHDNYVEIDNKLRKAFFKEVPEARVLYEVLMGVFDTRQGGSCKVQDVSDGQ